MSLIKSSVCRPTWYLSIFGPSFRPVIGLRVGVGMSSSAQPTNIYWAPSTARLSTMIRRKEIIYMLLNKPENVRLGYSATEEIMETMWQRDLKSDRPNLDQVGRESLRRKHMSWVLRDEKRRGQEITNKEQPLGGEECDVLNKTGRGHCFLKEWAE